MWTGRYPRTLGVTLVATPLPMEEPTLPERLRESGYHVASFGKTHYYFPRRGQFDRCVDLPEYRDWLSKKGPIPVPPGIETLKPWRPFADPARDWLNARCLPFANCEEDMPGVFYARGAAEFLKNKPKEPFFLSVGFYETHSPFFFPIEYRDRHKAKKMRAPVVTDQHRDEIPSVFADLTQEDRHGVLASVHTSAEFLDANVGTVLDALEQSGLTSNTLVVFLSDHGAFLGQRGRFEKHSCLDPAIWSSLVVRWPGVVTASSRSAALVQLFDLTPTILQACGLAIPDNVQAKSILPILKNQESSVRDSIFLEYSDSGEAAVRTGRWKLIYQTGTRTRTDGLGRPGETSGKPTIRLYDVLADPNEDIDLSQKPEYRDIQYSLLGDLVHHVANTARNPEYVPVERGDEEILDFCLPPSFDELERLNRIRMHGYWEE